MSQGAISVKKTTHAQGRERRPGRVCAGTTSEHKQLRLVWTCNVLRSNENPQTLRCQTKNKDRHSLTILTSPLNSQANRIWLQTVIIVLQVWGNALKTRMTLGRVRTPPGWIVYVLYPIERLDLNPHLHQNRIGLFLSPPQLVQQVLSQLVHNFLRYRAIYRFSPISQMVKNQFKIK